jgi:RNA polymerase sigma factor (sigma-70 family)
MPATDVALLELWIAARDGEAFNELVSRYAGLVHGACRRVLGDAEDAQDVAQDCFLKLARVSSPPVEPRQSLAGWLHTVATRAAIDLLRVRSRRRKHERRAAELRGAASAPESSAGEATWDEIEEHVDASIAELPGELREVVIAHFVERRTQEAIAAELGVSRQTVHHRARRGIERIRAGLRKRGLAVPAALGSLLAANLCEAAPAGLAAALGKLALSGLTPLASAHSTVSIPTLVVLGGLAMGKKVVVIAVVVMVLLAGGALTIVRLAGNRPGPTVSRPAPAAKAVEDLPPAPSGATPPAAGKEAGPLDPRAVTGAVVDASGRPVSGARIVAASPALEKVAETRTDADGRFALVPPGPAPVSLWAFRSAVGLALLEAVSPGEHGLEVRLERLCHVSGRITDRESGEGIEGMRVRLSLLAPVPGDLPIWSAKKLFDAPAEAGLSSGLAASGGEVTTDAGGRYAFEDLAPVRFLFDFRQDTDHVLPGYRGEDRPPGFSLEPGERRTGVDFALERGGAISGRVLGPDGAPLEDARVEIVPSFHVFREFEGQRSDREGRYRFRGLLPDASYFVRAFRKGLAPATSDRVPLEGAVEVPDVILRLSAGHAVRGTLADDAGMPIDGVEVSIADSFERRSASSGYGHAVTAADGSFAFEAVGPGRKEIHVFTDLHDTRQVRAFDMPLDRDLIDLRFVLRRKAPGSISGRVTDGSGAPVPEVRVLAGGGATSGETTTAADGTYRIENLGDAGLLMVDVYSEEHAFGRRFGVPVGSAGVDFVLSRYGRVRGRVLDAATGKPLERFELRPISYRPQPGSEGRYPGDWRRFDASTGEFLLERVEPFEVQIEARADGSAQAASRRFRVGEGETVEGVDLRLERGVTLPIRVVDAATGEPLAGARVRAHEREYFHSTIVDEDGRNDGEPGIWRLAVSDPEGRLEIPGLAAGSTIQLAAWREGYGTLLLREVQVASRGSTPLDLRMEREAAVRLLVRAMPEHGEGVAIFVSHREERPWRLAFSSQARLDRDGAAEVRGLPPGKQRIAFHAVLREDGHAGFAELLGVLMVEVAAGEVREVALDLEELSRKLGAIAVSVRGAVDPKRVFLRLHSVADPEESWTMGSTRLDARGRARFGGLLPGEYVIKVNDYAEPPVEREARVTVGGPGEVEVTIDLR